MRVVATTRTGERLVCWTSDLDRLLVEHGRLEVEPLGHTGIPAGNVTIDARPFGVSFEPVVSPLDLAAVQPWEHIDAITSPRPARRSRWRALLGRNA